MAIEDRIEEMRIMATKEWYQYGGAFQGMVYAGHMESLVRQIIVASVANFDGEHKRAFSTVPAPASITGTKELLALSDLEKFGFITRNDDKTEAVVTDKLLDKLKQHFGMQNISTEIAPEEKAKGK